VNIHRATVSDFGREWRRFDQDDVADAELAQLFRDFLASLHGIACRKMPSALVPGAAADGGPHWQRRGSVTCTAWMQAHKH